MERLAADAQLGARLQAAGHDVEALEIFDRALTRAPASDRDAVVVLLAAVMYSKAYSLQSLKRSVEAEVLAAQAADRASSISAPNARLVAARARGVQRSALTALGRHDRALAVDQALVAELSESECFELRACAGNALMHEIWTYGHRGEDANSIICARQLVELLGADADPEHLVEIGELLLSGAEQLNHRRIWRRAAPAITGQADQMCDAVAALAHQVGGDVGEAVGFAAQLTKADVLVYDHRLRASYTHRANRPSIALSALPALAQVEDKARESGSEGRWLVLGMTRATTLADAGQTHEALAILDHLQATYTARQRLRRTTAPLAIRALRRSIKSQIPKSPR